MDCSIITTKIKDIASKKEEFDSEFQGSPKDMAKILALKEKMVFINGEILDALDPALLLIEKLKDPKTWELYDSKVRVRESNGNRYIDYPDGEGFVGDIFTQFSYFGGVRSETLASLINYLHSIQTWLAEHFEALKNINQAESFGTTELLRDLKLRSIFTSFLNKVIRPENRLVVNGLPDELAYRFGKNLKCGLIQVDHVGEGLGESMVGGEILAVNAGRQVGRNMEGGRIVVKGQTTGETGISMEGGKIYVNEHPYLPSDPDSDWPLGYESNHGTIVCKYDEIRAAGVNSSTDIFIDNAKGPSMGLRKSAGVIIANRAGKELGRDPREPTSSELFGTLYAGEYEDSAPEKSEMETFTFDEQSKHYFDLRKKEVVPVIADDQALSDFKEKRCGLVVIENLVNIQQNITEGMDGGIVVLKELPKSELGKGMIRGAVIIDNPKITREEILAVLSKDRDYGLILQRVPDPENPKKTKLSDVEFQF